MLSATERHISFARAFTVFLVFAVFISPARASARGMAMPASGVPAARELISTGWMALEEEMRIEDIDRALKNFEKALELDPGNADLLAEISQEYFLRADQMPGSAPKELVEREKWFKKGISTAKKSLAIRETAAGHYWCAVNLASSVKRKSVFFQIKEFPAIRNHMLWVERNEKNYRYGAVAFFWGRVVAEAPAPAVRMIGEDPEEVFKDMENSIGIEPRFIQNYLYMALCYYDMGKKDEALDILGRAIRMDPEALAREKAHNRYALRLAKKKWKVWTGRDHPGR